MKLTHTCTEDGLRLQGFHYAGTEGGLCLVHVHGMSGNFLEDSAAWATGELLAKNGIGYLYGHNRGHSHMNDIPETKAGADGFPSHRRIGATYERFTECAHDIEAWVTQAKKLGYNKIAISGHSLGTPKVLYWWGQTQPTDIAGVALLSGADMIGLSKKDDSEERRDVLLKEARAAVAEGKPTHLLKSRIWDWYVLSAQTYLDFSEENSPCNVYPLYNPAAPFTELASINAPILWLVGKKDSVFINSAEEDSQLAKSKATSCPKFESVIVPGADHCYNNAEEVFAESMLGWLQSL